MAWKVKVKTAAGETVEGELETLPDGVIAEDDFEERFNERFGRRATSLEKKALEKAMKDETFKERALSEWGINLAELAKGGEVNAEKLGKALEEWRKTELGPVAQERDTLKSEVQSLLDRQLEAEILRAAAAAGVRQQYLKPLTEGATPMIVAAMRTRFGYDPETKRFYEKDATGEFVFSKAPKQGQPYRTTDEFFRVFAEDKANADYLDDRRPRGPNLGQPGAGGGDVVISRADATRHDLYTAAEAKAKESGGRVIVQG